MLPIITILGMELCNKYILLSHKKENLSYWYEMWIGKDSC